MSPGLSMLLLAPLIGAGVVALLPAREPGVAKALTLAVTLAELAIGWAVLSAFDPELSGPQLAQTYPWVDVLGIHLRLEVDGLSLPLVVLTIVLIPLALAGGWGHVRDQGRELGVPLLVFEAGTLAVLLSADVGLMFAGWELVAFSAWGLLLPLAEPRQLRWANRWLVGTQVGAGLWMGALMMLAVGHYGVTQGEWSLRLSDLEGVMLPADLQRIGFAAVALAVAFAAPIFPVHAWMPALTRSRNPVAGAVLAAMLVELGVYVLGRVGVGLFPLGAADLGQAVAWLAAIGVVHAGFVLRAERSVGRIAGYVVIAGAGVEVIGVLTMHPDGLVGAGLFGLGRALGVTALVLVLAAVRHDSGSDVLERVRGLGHRCPRTAGLLAVALVASLAAPGFAGFAGLLAVLAAGTGDAAVGLFDPLPVVCLAAVGSMAMLAVGLGHWQRVLVPAAPGGRRGGPALMAPRETLAIVVLVGLGLGLGLLPAEMFGRGLWSARERLHGVHEHLCAAEAARALPRPELYENLDVDCADPITALRERATQDQAGVAAGVP